MFVFFATNNYIWHILYIVFIILKINKYIYIYTYYIKYKLYTYSIYIDYISISFISCKQ